MASAVHEEQVRSRRRRRRVLYLGFCVFAAVIALTVLAYKSYRASVRHFYMYAGYANALHEYFDSYDECPATLQTLEAFYNAKGPSSAVIPPPDGRRPDFHPAPKGAREFYLVVIAPPPTEWCDTMRLVIYASPAEGSVDPKLIPYWTLDKLIAEDEALRARNQNGEP
ncbi:MAG: hypothetical protein JXO22_07975 [Phycisphaerae bacterium]|nr:hypothetical protein [Phycisphaerae bacterium]